VTAANLTGLKVVVVDDSNTIRRSAEVFLKQVGCVVALAEDGFAAMAVIVEQRPDIVFVDVMMPRLDGYQACALIKSNPQFHAMPVIMLTSKDGVFDRARGRLAGCDDYLTKPFTKDSLLTAVANHARRAETPQPTQGERS
jgi:twitching motility two-component system response regulator PilG